MRWFETQHDLLLHAALDDAAWKLVAGMANYVGCQRNLNEWIRVGSELLDVVNDEDGVAMLSLGLGGVMRNRGEVAAAISKLRRALSGFALVMTG